VRESTLPHQSQVGCLQPGLVCLALALGKFFFDALFPDDHLCRLRARHLALMIDHACQNGVRNCLVDQVKVSFEKEQVPAVRSWAPLEQRYRSSLSKMLARLFCSIRTEPYWQKVYGRPSKDGTQVVVFRLREILEHVQLIQHRLTYVQGTLLHLDS